MELFSGLEGAQGDHLLALLSQQMGFAYRDLDPLADEWGTELDLAMLLPFAVLGFCCQDDFLIVFSQALNAKHPNHRPRLLLLGCGFFFFLCKGKARCEDE